MDSGDVVSDLLLILLQDGALPPLLQGLFDQAPDELRQIRDAEAENLSIGGGDASIRDLEPVCLGPPCGRIRRIRRRCFLPMTMP